MIAEIIPTLGPRAKFIQFLETYKVIIKANVEIQTDDLTDEIIENISVCAFFQLPAVLNIVVVNTLI